MLVITVPIMLAVPVPVPVPVVVDREGLLMLMSSERVHAGAMKSLRIPGEGVCEVGGLREGA